MINNPNSLRFVVKIPEKLAPERAAPLLCAGVTAYSPLRKFCRSRPGLKGGILGLGGVGHVGVQIAKAMGHRVTVISSSDRKREEALEHLGADAFLVSSDGGPRELGLHPRHHPSRPFARTVPFAPQSGREAHVGWGRTQTIAIRSCWCDPR